MGRRSEGPQEEGRLVSPPLPRTGVSGELGKRCLPGGHHAAAHEGSDGPAAACTLLDPPDPVCLSFTGAQTFLSADCTEAFWEIPI